eukprot:362355-Chlamydomonas_euryale.AAC.4
MRGLDIGGASALSRAAGAGAGPEQTLTLEAGMAAEMDAAAEKGVAQRKRKHDPDGGDELGKGYEVVVPAAKFKDDDSAGDKDDEGDDGGGAAAVAAKRAKNAAEAEVAAM